MVRNIYDSYYQRSRCVIITLMKVWRQILNKGVISVGKRFKTLGAHRLFIVEGEEVVAILL